MDAYVNDDQPDMIEPGIPHIPNSLLLQIVSFDASTENLHLPPFQIKACSWEFGTITNPFFTYTYNQQTLWTF